MSANDHEPPCSRAPSRRSASAPCRSPRHQRSGSSMKLERPKSSIALLGARLLPALVRGTVMLAATMGAGAGLVGCGTTPGSEASSTYDDTGSVSLELMVGGGAQLSQVSYDITGGSFHRTGTLDVSNSASVSGIVGGIPFGSGYVARLTASSAGTPLLSSDGSAPFDVTTAAGQPV